MTMTVSAFGGPGGPGGSGSHAMTSDGRIVLWRSRPDLSGVEHNTQLHLLGLLNRKSRNNAG